jgi:hypothetical protein
MYPAFVVALFMLMASMLVSLVGQYSSRTDYIRQSRIRVEQTRMAEGLAAYRAEKGTMPASLDALIAEPGFEYLGSYRNQWMGYAVSGTLTDGTWQFERAAMWTARRKDGGATYATENECGTGDVYTAQSWCGAKDGTWFRVESREFFPDEITQEKVRQRRTLQLLADYWTAKQSFPRVGNNGVTLASGQLAPLPALVGYTGTAATCSGVYTWMGIPFDCGALFDVWGSPVGYQYQNDAYVILASEAPFASATGVRVIVASPLKIQG